MNKKSVYVSPEIKAIDVESESVLCAMSVENPFEGLVEEGWLQSLLAIENYDGSMKLQTDSGKAGAVAGSDTNSLVFYFKNTMELPNNAEITIGLSTDGGATSKLFKKTFPEGMAAVTENSFKAISIPFESI